MAYNVSNDKTNPVFFSLKHKMTIWSASLLGIMYINLLMLYT